MSPETTLTALCPLPNCPVKTTVAIQRHEISTLKSDVRAIKKALDRIQWATISVLAAACAFLLKQTFFK